MHNPGTNVAALSTLFQGLLRTWRAKCRMSLGNRLRSSKVSQAWVVCERSSIWAASGGDKICLLSSRLLPAANGSYRAANLRHCSKPWFSFGSSDNFQSFPFCPRDQEMLQFLVHLVCHVEFVLKVCHSERLLLILCGLHRLLQRYVHHADEVSRQIRPSSPAGAVFLSEPVGHQGLWLHQLDARPRIDHTAECSQFLMHRLLASRNSL